MRVDAAAFIRSGAFEIEVACERHHTKASPRPLYDPKGERLKS